MSMPALAPTQLPSTGCRAVDTDGRALPLRATHLRATAGGGHARVELEQTFHNPHAEALDITYTLPLPADGAVAGFRFLVGDNEVVGEVQTRAQARETFETAVLEGRTAALLEEERSSVFRQQLGNVPPGATLTCYLTIDQPLAWEDGEWTWRFPTVVGPRYLGTSPPPSAAGVVVDVASSGTTNAVLTGELTITDARTGPPSSPSHAIRRPSGVVTLGGALDRDAVVRWPVRTPSPGVSVQVARHGDEAYAAITVVPPTQPAPPVPRHLVVLLDTSGSMGGRPLDQAKEITGALIATLGPADQLELLAFASSVERFADGPVAMTASARQRALGWLRARRAGGGTEMTSGIRAAVAGPTRDGAQKQVVLVTDGYIGFESEIVGIALDERDRATRIHTVGVGSSVNRSLTEPVARAGGGLELLLGIDEPAGPAAARLVARTTAPVLVDLELAGTPIRTTSHRLPDLYAGAPVTLFAAVDPAGGEVVLSGRSSEGPWTHTLALPAAREPGPASVRYARDQVADLELLVAAGRRVELREQRIEALGLGFQISTRFTSWVAATRERTVDPDAESRAVTQPQALPHGVSAEGVGLRPAQALTFGAAVGGGGLGELLADQADAELTRSARPSPKRRKTVRRARAERSAAPPPIPMAKPAPGAPLPPPQGAAPMEEDDDAVPTFSPPRQVPAAEQDSRKRTVPLWLWALLFLLGLGAIALLVAVLIAFTGTL